MGVGQWMSSVMGTEKSTCLTWATSLKQPKILCRALELERYMGEEVVMEELST